jgi:flagellar transcriptional activator FlhC
MDSRRIERHLRALALARDCVALGARIAIVEAITGLRRKLIAELFSSPSLFLPGRMPRSIWEDLNTTLLRTVVASELCRMFEELLRLGVDQGAALVTAYRLYAARFEAVGGAGPRRKRCVNDRVRLDITFDRAFALVQAAFGIWNGERQLQMSTCQSCHCRYVAVLGLIPSDDEDCPYCRLRRNFEKGRLFGRVAKLPHGHGLDGVAALNAPPSAPLSDAADGLELERRQGPALDSAASASFPFSRHSRGPASKAPTEAAAVRSMISGPIRSVATSMARSPDGEDIVPIDVRLAHPSARPLQFASEAR